MRYGSVCSGVEAASLAWEPLGWQPVFYSEIDPFPSHVLHHRWSSGRPQRMPDPDAPGLDDDERKERRNAIKAVAKLPAQTNGTPNLGDMTQFQEWPDYAIDLLAGGTPCQSYSVAGLREGLDDPRGDLTLTFAAIARRYRPSWLVWENVVGVLSHDGGRSFASLLGLLSGQRVEVPSGGWKSSGFVEGYKSAYGLAWRVLNTEYVRTSDHPSAIPQRRRRVILVGYLGDGRRARAVFLEPDGLSGNPPPRREAGQNAAGTIASRTGRSRSGGLGTDLELDGGLVSQPLLGKGQSSHDDSKETYVADPVGLSIDASMGKRRGSGMNPNQIVAVPEVGNTLTHRMHKGVNTTMDEGQTMIPVVAGTLRGEGFDATEDGSGRTTLLPVVGTVSPTLRAGGNSTGGDRPPGTDVDTVESLIAFNVRQDPLPEAEDVSGPLHGDDGFPNAIALSSKDYGADAQNEVSPTLRAMGARAGVAPNSGGQVAVAFQPRVARNDRGGPIEVAYPLTAEAGRTGKGDSAQAVAIPGDTRHATPSWRVRRLTPTECARLQGQPDEHCLIPWGGKPAEQCPDGPQYKAYGNSMSTNVMEFVGVRIQMVQDLIDSGAI